MQMPPPTVNRRPDSLSRFSPPLSIWRVGRAWSSVPEGLSKVVCLTLIRLPLMALIALIALITLTGGCSGPGSRDKQLSGPSQTITDGMGRKVTLPTPPQRIVSLAPNITEILFALGVGEKVVGVTSYCDYPAEATTREKVGDTISPNLERIVALRPDLVIVSTASQLESLTQRLTALSIPVFVCHSRTIQEILDSVRQLGEVTGRSEAGAALVAEMRERMGRVEARVARLPRIRVLYVLQTQPLISVGRDTYLNDLIRLAGGESITASEVGYPQFSRETVLARAPEVILFPASHGNDQVEATAIRQSLATTPAIRTNRLVRIDPDWANRPGPRIVEALEQFAQAIHPESP